MIYYFSTTGNSLALARELGEALDDKIISITRTSGTVLEGPAIGLVFPVYYGDVPANVAEFVRSHDPMSMLWAPAAAPGAAASGPSSSCWRQKAVGFPGAGRCPSLPTAPSVPGPISDMI